MNKTYVIHLKNGDSCKINQEQQKKLMQVLTGDDVPEFITISGNIIRTDYIATIKAEAW